MNRLTTKDMRDAVAFLTATAVGDVDGRMAVARDCDAAHLVDCLASFALGLAEQTIDGGPLAWVQMLGANVEEIDQHRRGGDDSA